MAVNWWQRVGPDSASLANVSAITNVPDRAHQASWGFVLYHTPGLMPADGWIINLFYNRVSRLRKYPLLIL